MRRFGLTESKIIEIVSQSSIGVVRYGEALELSISLDSMPSEIMVWLNVSRLFESLTSTNNQASAVMVEAVSALDEQFYFDFNHTGLRFGVPVAGHATQDVNILRNAAINALMALSKWYESNNVAEVHFAHDGLFLTLIFDKSGNIRNKTNTLRTEDNTLIRRAMMSVKLPLLRRTYREMIETKKFEKIEAIDGLLFEINALLTSCSIVKSISKI